MSLNSESKVVLVTGCSKGGIGFSLCEDFATRGCRVYATARRLDSMTGLAHPNIQCLVLDVTSEDNAESVVKTIIDAEGRIDIVVNNAGASCAGPMMDIPVEAVQGNFDANVFGVLRVSKAVFPHMAKRKSGTVVNIGSILGLIPTPWNGTYCASKAALHAITEVLWEEYKPFNINVMLVAPGGIRSNVVNNQLAKGVNMPDNSFYKPFTAEIWESINLSQGSGAMPTADFSKTLVETTLLPKPPKFLSVGLFSTWFWLYSWLPRMWILGFFTWVFKRNVEKAKTT